jgi:adenylate cyclase
MATEIERKFLVTGNDWKPNRRGTPIRQAYLARNSRIALRVRLYGARSYLSLKTRRSGISRDEFEYAISRSDGLRLLRLSTLPVVEKVRYSIRYDGMLWEVDEFGGKNKGLVIAEVELKRRNQRIKLPSWVGREVSHEARYFNMNLARRPFSQWSQKLRQHSPRPL